MAVRPLSVTDCSVIAASVQWLSNSVPTLNLKLAKLIQTYPDDVAGMKTAAKVAHNESVRQKHIASVPKNSVNDASNDVTNL